MCGRCMYMRYHGHADCVFLPGGKLAVFRCLSWGSLAESSLFRNGPFVSAPLPHPCGEGVSPATDPAPRRRRALVRDVVPD